MARSRFQSTLFLSATIPSASRRKKPLDFAMARSRFQHTLFLLMLTSMIAVSVALEDDVKCLKGVKGSLSDPLGKLSSWDFSNTSIGYICKFVGVSCWNERENRLIGLSLPTMTLSGQIPESLQYCQSLQTLDLSGNSLTGSISSDFCTWLPYLVSLDLSSNDLSGPIPSKLVKCQYLNTLILNDNHLKGSIPYELSGLSRLKKLSVANNYLSGSIPSFLSNFDPAGFDGNSGLCGSPLGNKCGGLSKKNLIIIVAAGIFGALVSLLLGLALWWWCIVKSSRRRRRRRHGTGKDDDSSWAHRLRTHKLVQVSLFQKPLVKIKLADLMAATNNFDPDNIIISTRAGTTYKAVLSDGSALAIKRLNTCKLSEKQFRSEMNRLGQLRHPNLVPLLGFCVVEDEKLLVYKHMANGTLFSVLHGSAATRNSLDWPTRLKIGTGAARGLAWLHHGCQPAFLHQNISSNVIFLDEELDARIIDFGLARLLSSAGSNGSTFVHGDFGEFGYVAPEYSSTMVASLKGDVYGFGVVLLELVTGLKPLEVTNAEEGFKGNLVDWVNTLTTAGRNKDVIDKSLLGKGHDGEIMQFLKIACGCVVTRAKDRSTMYQVYQSLRTISESQDLSEQFDEFPLIFGKQDPDHLE
ncbi:probable inactive receptor kinase At1g27190 [Macadamia integrifolia]|uniref:probable inactive receptor kinase At1g27190 n=1 Tax=Macadamia integrifolia TaxID=60698 RepID=UPI001C4FBFEC|nr:probable inactive receptor kinase At1g27190 [Macadamia integrifolia]